LRISQAVHPVSDKVFGVGAACEIRKGTNWLDGGLGVDRGGQRRGFCASTGAVRVGLVLSRLSIITATINGTANQTTRNVVGVDNRMSETAIGMATEHNAAGMNTSNLHPSHFRIGSQKTSHHATK